MTKYTFTEAKQRIGHVVGLAMDGQPIALTRYGLPTVMLVPVERYRELLRLEREFRYTGEQ